MQKQKVLRKLGQIISAKRLAKEFSQEDLAERADLDRTYISGLERGVRNPSLTALVKLGNGLGLTVGELLQGLGSFKTTEKRGAGR
jgi:transcriptional regulator with XRE-family HTH domain